VQDLIELDRDDEQSGRMQEIHEHLLDAYLQSTPAEGSARGQIPSELVMEDPAQEASESSQELCDAVQEVFHSIQEHAVEHKLHSV
jgi:calcium permeable stress-gated cation channel